MLNKLKTIQASLFKPVSAAPLAVLRILFGLLMLASTIRFLMLGWVQDQYLNPGFHFTYYGFEWVKPFGPTGMYLVFAFLILASFSIAIGFWYRFFMPAFFLAFTYVELLDKAYYLNHYYFISIVALLLIFVPANRYFSVDAWLKPKIFSRQVPLWAIAIFKLQLGIVYFYAGFAKLVNWDWMVNAMPLKIWLPPKDYMPLIGWMFNYDWAAYLFSWSGAFYDLSIPFLLLYSRTRPFAYLAVIGFHIITWWLFQIGMFPWIMIGITLIFFPPKLHQNIINILARPFGKMQKPVVNGSTFNQAKPKQQKVITALLTCFFLFQILFPLHGYLYPGHIYWNEEGFRYSWRVMLMEKAGHTTFYVQDSKTSKKGMVFNDQFLNRHQEKQMSMKPDMILEFAHFLHDYYEKQGVHDPVITAESRVTLNGRENKPMVDSTVNLADKARGWHHKDWVIPFDKHFNKHERLTQE